MSGNLKIQQTEANRLELRVSSRIFHSIIICTIAHLSISEMSPPLERVLISRSCALLPDIII